jgi:hypothetical protein
MERLKHTKNQQLRNSNFYYVHNWTCSCTKDQNQFEINALQGVVKFQRAKKAIGLQSKLGFFLHMSMWCHSKCIIVMGNCDL